MGSAFSVGREAENDCNDAKDDGTGNEGVGAPVGRLGVPATGRRPDVLRVTVDEKRKFGG